jgi:transcriptional regulator with XRE-family HTH domain
MTQTSLGRRLRLLRAERQLSLRQAAARAGVVKETISDIERGATHPQDVTLAKLAHAYEVPVEDLLEEPVPLDEAPPPGHDEQLIEDPEEDRHIRPVSTSTLEWWIGFIKLLKEQREAKIEEVKQGAPPPPGWIFHLQADDKYLEICTADFSPFVEAVTARRWMADFSIQRLCHELSRQFVDFVKLTDEAKALYDERMADHHETSVKETAKGVPQIERFLHNEFQQQRGPESR